MTQHEKEKRELTWKTPHQPARPRTPDWYWTIGTVAVAAALIAGYFGNYLFAIIAIIAAFIIIIESGKAKGGEHVTIVTKGIRVGKTLYPVAGIHSFHLNEEVDPPHLSLKLNRPFVPTVEIELGDADVQALHNFLKKYLPEEHHEERLADVITKSLGL